MSTPCYYCELKRDEACKVCIHGEADADELQANARDAARYRLIRDRWQFEVKEGVIRHMNMVVSEEWGAKLDAELDKTIGRPSAAMSTEGAGMKKIFDTIGGNFEACREAEEWCEERGISVGAMERDKPRGLLDEPCLIGKWSNLSGVERRQMIGTMTGDMRHGPVIIELKGDDSDYPIIPEKYR